MPKRNEKYLSLYFNLDDPEQNALFRFAGSSKRVKRILLREMEGGSRSVYNSPEQDVAEVGFTDDLAALI